MPSRVSTLLIALVLFLSLNYSDAKGYIPHPDAIDTTERSPRPHTYVRSKDLPLNFDWRSVNGTNYASHVITQQSPNVCGSCWAEAATGALSDRYIIATQGKLRAQLSVQQLLNFGSKITGGTCNGGDDLKAYDFIHKYGISDDTCAPFVGLDMARGFQVNAMKDVDEVRAHQCYLCMWDGSCTFVRRESYNLYGADEFGTVKGVSEMMAEVFARGPIACSVNSESEYFNAYSGGIITCPHGSYGCNPKFTDHVIVIAGWGTDAETGMDYWVGRNSYGTQWGEGMGGGWFRLQRGTDTIGLESHKCSWAVPARADVQRVMEQFDASVAV